MPETLQITEFVDMECALDFRDRVHDMLAEGHSHLDVLITSGGGEVIAGMTIIDTIREAQQNGVTVTTRVLGRAASIAATISQVGDHRVMGKNAYLVFHESSMQVDSPLSEMRRDVELLERFNLRSKSIACEKSKLELEDFLDMMPVGEWWVDSEDAMIYGFTDEVI